MRAEGFNTGRLYTSHGQRISWAVLEDGTVLFNDHDRMIFGALTHKAVTAPVTPRFIMNAYDRYEYGYDARASQLDAGEWGPSLRI